MSPPVNLSRNLAGLTARRVMIALALVALALRVLIPSGFMVADAKTNHGYPVVICTGHGTLTLDSSGDHKSPAPKSKPDAPCAFAGMATPVAPTLAALAPPSYRLSQPAPAEVRPDQIPGRGLAAPPPPAIGPPRLI
jgi:hypothetical protein